MLNTPAEIAATLLFTMLDAGNHILFTDPVGNPGQAWPVFVSSMPDAPNSAGAVYDTEGMVHTRLLTSGLNLISYGIQIKTRALSYPESYAKCWAAVKLFESVKYGTTVAVGENVYQLDTIRQMSTVLSLGQDNGRRTMHSVNVLLSVLQ